MRCTSRLLDLAGRSKRRNITDPNARWEYHLFCSSLPGRLLSDGRPCRPDGILVSSELWTNCTGIVRPVRDVEGTVLWYSVQSVML